MNSAMEEFAKYTHSELGWENEQVAAKEATISLLEELKPLIDQFANGQLGEYSPDITASKLQQFSIPNRWPNVFTYLEPTETRKELSNLFCEVIEIGVIVNCMVNSDYRNYDTVEEVDLRILNKVWLRQMGASVKSLKTRKTSAYNGVDEIFINFYKETKFVPFYLSKGIKSGFMGKTIGNLKKHARWMFYAGIWLPMLYDVGASRGNSTMSSLPVY